MGWGLTKGHGPDNNQLKQVGVQINADYDCRRRVANYPGSKYGNGSKTF